MLERPNESIEFSEQGAFHVQLVFGEGFISRDHLHHGDHPIPDSTIKHFPRIDFHSSVPLGVASPGHSSGDSAVDLQFNGIAPSYIIDDSVSPEIYMSMDRVVGPPFDLLSGSRYS